MSPKPVKKPAAKKAPARRSKPSYASKKELSALEARVDNIVANLTNRQGFNPEADNNDVAFTGEQPAAEPAEAPAE